MHRHLRLPALALIALLVVGLGISAAALGASVGLGTVKVTRTSSTSTTSTTAAAPASSTATSTTSSASTASTATRAGSSSKTKQPATRTRRHGTRKAAPRRRKATQAAGGTVLPSVAGEATNPANGNQYVFWRGPGGRIYEAWYTSSWHGPIGKSWHANSAPSAAVTNQGAQYVVWEGRGGHIFEAADTGNWGSPRDLTKANHWGRAGTTSVSPSITVNPQTGAQYLFWRGPGNRIYEATEAGHWSGAERRGWTSASAPVAGATGSGNLFVFWTSANHHIQEAWHYSRWRGPSDLSRSQHWGATTGTPGAAVNPGNGHQYVFWRASNGRIEEGWNTGRWHGPAKLRWSTNSGPSLAVSDSGNQYVLWLSRNRIWEATHVTSWTGAVARWKLGPGRGRLRRGRADHRVALPTHVGPLRPAVLRRRHRPPAGDQGQRREALPAPQGSGRRDDRHLGVADPRSAQPVGLSRADAQPLHDARDPPELHARPDGRLGLHPRPACPTAMTTSRRARPTPTLAHFSIAHDKPYILPVLRQMVSISPKTETFAVPWSPPAWMKANDNLNDLGHRGSLLSADYRPLAQYFVKFIKAYAAQGVPVQAVAPENEPRSGARFPSMYFPESAEAQWIAQDLGPALQSAGLRPRCTATTRAGRCRTTARASPRARRAAP